MNPKLIAAERAAEYIRSGMVLGLGSGSTAHHLLEVLALRLQSGELTDIRGIPTSGETAHRARQLGIPLITLDEHPQPELAIDGADEVSPELHLIKGRGGALLREKIVAAAARRFVVIVDNGKRVERLGTRSALPVEVVPFGWRLHLPRFAALGAQAMLREEAPGQPYITDNGNFIIDCTFPEGISDPYALAAQLDRQPGIVEHGLFLAMAHLVIYGDPAGPEVVSAATAGRSN